MKKRVTIKLGIEDKIGILIVAFLLCAAIGKLVYVAVADKVDGIDLKTFAENRNTKTKTLYASRGSIFDANGDVLASSVNSYTLIAYLSDTRKGDYVVDKQETAEKLSPILGISVEEIMGYLSKDKYQVEFGKAGKNLTETIKRKIDELNLPGIDFILGTQRYYKMGDFASYIVGYAKEDENNILKGELGIESYFNNLLSGTNGSYTYESDAKGYKLPNATAVTEEAQNGSDIYLTIDSNIELICENAINELSENYDMDWGLITVADAKTGAIVASATNPSYNPNDLNTLSSYLNPLVSYTYEPGSTMKIFSWASAIEEGIYNGDDTYLSGSIEVADVKISDFNKVGWGYITYDTGFAYSSNVAATNLALRLGTDKLMSHYETFGFGKKTGIELSGELEGTIDFKYKSELATASFGQGITVTPIQLIQALTSVANDGVMLKPYVVDKIVDSNGNVTYSGGRNEIGQVMSASTAQKMKSLMYNVNYNGLMKMWQPKTVKMIIKTGTAQIASPSGGYMSGQYDKIYSLAGIFPDDEPKYIIYVAVKRIIGSQRAIADMTTKVVDEIAAYANITESNVDTTENNKTVSIDNYISKNTADVKSELESKGLNVIVLGSGDKIIDQYPKAGQTVLTSSKVFLKTNNDDYTMINLTSFSLSEVKTYANLVNKKLVYSGYGYVINQDISEGTDLKEIESFTISLG